MVLKVLDEDRLRTIREGCIKVVKAVVETDPHRTGNRGSHRYGFDGAVGHFDALGHWACIIDPPALNEVLTEILGEGYIADSEYFGGGDFTIPGCLNYQELHRDSGDPIELDGVTATSGKNGGPHSAHYQLQGQDFRDFPCPKLTVNYPMELTEDGASSVGHVQYNGATRMIPGTQHSHDVIPEPKDEPAWMKLSIACPVPAGAALIRDLRCWHGGTPNLSEHTRALPGLKYWASWYRAGEFTKTMSCEIYATLSPHGQEICRYMVVAEGETPRFRSMQMGRWSHAEDGWPAPDELDLEYHALARL